MIGQRFQVVPHGIRGAVRDEGATGAAGDPHPNAVVLRRETIGAGASNTNADFTPGIRVRLPCPCVV